MHDWNLLVEIVHWIFYFLLGKVIWLCEYIEFFGTNENNLILKEIEAAYIYMWDRIWRNWVGMLADNSYFHNFFAHNFFCLKSRNTGFHSPGNAPEHKKNGCIGLQQRPSLLKSVECSLKSLSLSKAQIFVALFTPVNSEVWFPDLTPDFYWIFGKVSEETEKNLDF